MRARKRVHLAELDCCWLWAVVEFFWMQFVWGTPAPTFFACGLGFFGSLNNLEAFSWWMVDLGMPA
jgi:hypothetical protein